VLDIKLIREQPDVVKKNIAERGDCEKLEILDDLIECDREWRQLLTELNRLRHERNKVTAEVASLKKKGKSASKKLDEAKEFERKISKLEGQEEKRRKTVYDLLLRIPNLLHESVPVGKHEDDNVTVRKVGETPKFDFQVKNHVDLALSLGIIDIERAAKISGARFFALRNEGALLDMALMNFAFREISDKGFIPVEPPLMMRKKPYEGVIDLADFEETLYKVEEEDLYLIATSEHPMAAMHMNEVFIADELPLKYVGISPCFRKEAGAHGRDTKGIFRTHQFNKVEQFVFCLPEQSWGIHEELIRNAEELVQKLGLPYRVVNVCTGDIGTTAAKTYDIEAWMPAQDNYREIISCSNCTDYQARRLNIRYREKEGAPPKGSVHTLNSTAIATRTIVAILESFQQEKGSVIIPEALREYMYGIEEIKPH
jgi:seryl-tRNA synthetase